MPVLEVEWPVRTCPSGYDPDNPVPANHLRTTVPPDQFPVRCAACGCAPAVYGPEVGSVDKVVSWGILEAVQDKSWFLLETRRVLGYAGELVLLFTPPVDAEPAFADNLLRFLQVHGFMPLWWAADTDKGRIREMLPLGVWLKDGELVWDVGLAGHRRYTDGRVAYALEQARVGRPFVWESLPVDGIRRMLVATTGVGEYSHPSRMYHKEGPDKGKEYLEWSRDTWVEQPTTGVIPDDLSAWRPQSRAAGGFPGWAPPGWCPV